MAEQLNPKASNARVKIQYKEKTYQFSTDTLQEKIIKSAFRLPQNCEIMLFNPETNYVEFPYSTSHNYHLDLAFYQVIVLQEGIKLCILYSVFVYT